MPLSGYSPSQLPSGLCNSHVSPLMVCDTERALAAHCRLDRDLAAFLESQPEIRDLSLRGIPAYTSDPFTIPPSALPHLESFRSVHVDPDTLGEVCALVHPVFCPVRSTAAAQVVATRPVQGISLSLFSEHGYRALEALARTSTPVRRLTILIVDASAPSELFPQLAARLPHLEALHIVALVQQYNLVRHPFFLLLQPPPPVVLNVERFCRIRCSRPPRCSKPLPACDFSRSSLAARRAMNLTMKRLSRSSGHVRVRP